MKRLAKICTFLILIICGVVFAACGESGKTPILTPSVTNVDLVIGTDESKSFDIVVSDYANGSDSVIVESYEKDRIIAIESKKVAEGKTRVTLTPLYPGKATIKISSLTHSAKPVEVSVNVILPVGDIEIENSVKDTLYVIKGEKIDFESLGLINYLPIETGNPNHKDAKTNQEGVTYFIEGETSGLVLENGVLSVAEDCALSEISIKAVSNYNESIIETFKVKILNKISASLYVEGELVYQNGNLQEGKSSAFDLFPRESDITKSKEVLLQVVAGAEEDAIKVEKIFDETKFSVELKNYIFENGMFKYTYVVSALNSGYLDNISFNVAYMDYTFAEKGEDYYVESGNLTFASYNQPNAVLVNGDASGAAGVDIVVFENVVALAKATLLEFTLSPAHLPADCNTIRLFVSDYTNLPVNFYKLNSTRTGYELVLGYDKSGEEVKCFGSVDAKKGNLYYDMPVGTKLYIIKNHKFNLDNSTAKVYACELNDYNANGDRTRLQMNVNVNPGASSVNKAELTNDGFKAVIGANSIITEFEETDIYFAIAPNNFDIGATSVVKLKNSSLAKVSKLTVVGKDDNYVYVRFTITPEKLGTTKLTVYLCDGFTREFNLKIISSLDDIDVFVKEEQDEMLDYNKILEGTHNGTNCVVEKLAFKNGVTIQLDRVASPKTAEYALEYNFYDLISEKTITALTIQDIFENASFAPTSTLINANILKTYGIIQALANQSEGKTLIRVDVKGKMANGEYETDASHKFYFLVEIYKSVDNFEISQNTHEIYSYDTLGDRNSDKSKTKFTIDLTSKFGAPTYLNSLELYYVNANSTLVEFDENNKCEDISGLIITRVLNGVTWEFTVQALTNEVQNHVFIAKLVEVDQTKVLGGVIRLIVKPAVEIDDIEIVNVDSKEGIYIENFGTDSVNFEIFYNIYTKTGKEPLNNRLIFELSQNLIDLGVRTDIDNNGKLIIPANVGGVGTVLIYPESNYFDVYNGMKNGDIPFVELKITIANGESEETAIRINTKDKISYLKDYPTKHYILAADLSITETVEDFSGGLYGEHQGKIMTLTVENGAIFNKLTGKVKNLNIVGNVNASGLLANTNEGTIENVNVLAGSTIESDSGYVGGLVGKNFGTISGGVIEATISGVDAGGIVGINATETREIDGETKTVTGTIENVVFAGNITAGGKAGAIAAENAGVISGAKVERWSNNDAAIINSTGTDFVGGIAGVNSGTIEKCYAASYNNKTNDIIAETGKIGGIVGQNTGSIDQCMTNLSLKGTNIGAVVYETTGAISNVYTLSEVKLLENGVAFAFANFGDQNKITNVTNAYSAAYYMSGETKKYLTAQTAEDGTNCYCAGSFADENGVFNDDGFKNAVQALVKIKDEEGNAIWTSKEGELPYLANLNLPAPVDNIEINISESTDEFLGDKTNLDIVLYYYQLINQVDNENVKTELNNKNSINLIDIFGENDFIFENLSSNLIKIVGGKLSVLGVGKTTLKVTSRYATPDCQAKGIDFYVIYPIQDFNFYRGASSLNPSTIIKDGVIEEIKLSGSQLYNSNVKSTILLNGSNYSIYTNLHAVGFDVKLAPELDFESKKAYLQNYDIDITGLTDEEIINKYNEIIDKVVVGVNSIYNKDGYYFDKNNDGEISEDELVNAKFDNDYSFVADGTFKVQPGKIGAYEGIANPQLSLDAMLVLQNSEIDGYLGNITENADFDVINALISKKFKKNFEIKVVRGATRIQSTLTEAELTPSNVLTFEVELTTDELSVDDSNLKVEIVDKASGKIVSDISKEDAVFAVGVDLINSTGTNQHLYKVIISVTNAGKKVSEQKEYIIKISDAQNQEPLRVLVDLTLLPQEVENVSYSHYPTKTENADAFTTEVVPTTVLKPGKNGILALNLYPSYAIYEKIEIESAIIDEKYVLFEQMISTGNDSYKSASGVIGYSSEKDTNKLTIYFSNKLSEDNGMIYVRTKIIESVGDGVSFPITIRVYPSKDSGKEIKTATLVLTSETIDKAGISINGEKDAVVARGHTLNFQVTVKEDQELNAINVINYQRDFSDKLDYIYTVCNLSEYAIENGKKIYNASLVVGLNAETTNGGEDLEKADGVVQIQTVMNRWINGRLESAYDTAIVRIVDFTVDGIYIKGNDKEDNVFTAPIQIEQELSFGFILSETPVSSSLGANVAIERIENNKKAFLDSLSLADEQGRKYSINSGVSDYYKNIAYNMYYSSSNTKLFNEYGEYRANPNFDLRVEKNDEDKPKSATTVLINGLRSGSVAMQIKIGYKLPGLTDEQYVTYDFVIKVQIYEDEDFPITINNEEEFLKYMNATSTETGEPANYILMNDIYLKDFTPISNTTWIDSLDGNNKVITIKNFNINGMLNTNANQRLELALFQNVSENTTLKNLTINLFELENIVINENLVNDVNVAGLFINNYGAVYNCEVVAINMALIREYFKDKVVDFENIASGLNQGYTSSKYADGYGIRVYFDGENLNKLKSDNTTVKIGGLGITNYAVGKITNSRVGGTEFTKIIYDHNSSQNFEHTFTNDHISIHGQADIAGFVVENNGLIASSFFSNGNIENVAVSGTASKTAGFVVYNNFDSQITGCYAVGYKKLSEQNSKFYTDGGIYSEGIAAAFVYQNESIISDSYANMLMGGSLSGRIVSGFVYHNELNAEVQRCYSASKITGKLTTRMPFSGNNARGESMQLGTFTNCYYYVQNYETESLLEEKYSTGAYAVSATTVDEDLLYGFSFSSASTSSTGSNYDGVWEWNGDITLTAANDIAISVRYLIENYNGVKGAKRLPYVSKYAYGSENNPIIIRNADEFNRVFGQETNIKENAFYAISQYYNKSKHLVFGHYRLVSNINFNELQTIETTKISSSVMSLTNYGEGKIGVFDGNGLLISNIEIALNNTSVGLFSQVVNGAIVKNAELTVKQITSGNGTLVGGVAGYLYNASIVNIDLKPTTAKGDNRSEINGVNIVGGIVGLVKGNSRLSNVSSSISVISSYRGDTEYERSKIQYPDVSYAGGIVGVLDVYKNPGETIVTTTTKAQSNQLRVYGEAIIIEGYYVGGVIGYLGKSTYASDIIFEVTGGLSSSFEQKISSTGKTVGGIVGVNWGNISEARIEHEKDVQTAIEEGIYNSYTGSASRGGHSSLFEDAIKTDIPVQYAGGLVGDMRNGDITNSYSKVDVVLNSDYAGGIIGKNESNGELLEVYAFGDVDGIVSGGLIGLNSGKLNIKHAVAINYYSKNNSHIATATDIINKINGLDKTQGELSSTDVTSDLSIKYIYNDNLNIIFVFNKTKVDGVYAIQTAKILLGVNKTMTIAKIDNEYFVYVGNEWKSFEENNDVNLHYKKFFKVSDHLTLYQEDGKVYRSYTAGEVADEITDFKGGYYLSEIEVKNGEVVIYETTEIEETAKITCLDLKNLGSIVGDQGENGELIIGNEVFANKDLSLGEKIFKFVGKQGDNIISNSSDLVKSLEEYQGAAKDGILINRMFLSAAEGWDPNVWGKDADDMLPYLTFGITSKTLYIEKPQDFSRLWKYSGQGYMIIIGDDPATAFNPYKYKYDDTNSETWGEFTSAELTGLTLDESGNLYFNLSSIAETFVPKDFSGVLHGEFDGREYIISGLGDKPLFRNLNSAVIRNIGFGGTDEAHIAQSSSVLMAEKIDNSLVENIRVQNVIVNANLNTENIIGALCYEIISNANASEKILNDFTFNNVTLNIRGGDQNGNLTAGLLAGNVDFDSYENITFTNCALNVNSTFKSVNAGMFGEINTEGNVKFTNCKIEGGNIDINADVVDHAYIGGFAGLINSVARFVCEDTFDAIKDLTINFFDIANAHVTAGLMFGEAKEVIAENINLTGTITNTDTDSPATKYVVAQIGGLAGKMSGTITDISVTPTIDVNVISVTASSVSETSAIGGLVGELNGALVLAGEVNTKNNINVKNNLTSSDAAVNFNVPVIVGGVVGHSQELTNSITVDCSALNVENLTVEEGEEEIVSIKVTSGANANKVGGVVGFINKANVTLSENINVSADITSSGSNVVVGGIVGEIDLSSLDEEDKPIEAKATVAGTYSGNVNILEQNAATITVGGIVGQILENSEDTENVSEISNAIFDGNIVINPVEDSSVKITKILAGGIVGYAHSATINESKVSGHIQINADVKTGILGAGGIAGQINTTSVTLTTSWGNIMVKDGVTVGQLYIGGVVGYASGTWTFTGNKTLTSIYNKNLASENKLNNVRALVGHTVNTPEIDNDNKNQYSHMFNLAVDSTDLGENVLFGSIGLKDRNKTPGTKLNPIEINENTTNTTFGNSDTANAWEIDYYHQSKDDVSRSGITIGANAHLIGNGKTWSTSTTPISTNNGYVSGFKFKLTNVGQNQNIEGIVYTNNGVIYANSVVIYGGAEGIFANGETSKGAINSGVAGINNGLIMDTGALLYVNSATAGFVANNAGTILNSYVNGVVHNGATYSFNGGTTGRVENCYTTIRNNNKTGSAIFSGTLLNNFYDKYGTEKTQSDPNITEKTTGDMASDKAADGTSKQTDILNDLNGDFLSIFTQDYTINFGYPTLMGAGYSSQNAGCGYMKLETGNSTIASLLQIPNVGKLEQINSLGSKFQIITHIDYAKNNLTSHSSAEIESIIFEGNNYEINNIPSGTNGFFTKITNGRVQNIEFNYLTGATINDGQDAGEYAGAIANTAENIEFNNVRSSGATVSGTYNVGGLVGKMIGGSMENCFNFNDVSGNFETDDTTDILQDAPSAGGLVGCVNEVTFGGTKSERVGNYGNISVTFTSDNKYASACAGGIVGAGAPLITYAFNIGNVLGEEKSAGNISCGGISGACVVASGNDAADSNYLYNYGQIGAKGDKAYAYAIAAISYAEYVYNFGIVNNNGTVKVGEDAPYYDPALGSQKSSNSDAYAHALEWSNNHGSISSVDPSNITTAEQLAYIAKNISNYSTANIKLGADIDLTGYVWNPIGGSKTVSSGSVTEGVNVVYSASINGINYKLTIDSMNSSSYWVSRSSNFKQLGSGSTYPTDDTYYEKQTFTDLDNKLSFNIKIVNGKAIFNFSYYFSGSFDGDEHTITGMGAFDKNFAGLFGNIHNYNSEKTIIFNDVTMKNCVSQSLGNAGILAAEVNGGEKGITIQNITVKNSRVYGGSLESKTGGIVGYIETAVIQSCSGENNIVFGKGIATGGLVGGALFTKIAESTNKNGNVGAEYNNPGYAFYVGGIVGSLDYGLLEDDVKASNITRNTYGSGTAVSDTICAKYIQYESEGTSYNVKIVKVNSLLIYYETTINSVKYKLQISGRDDPNLKYYFTATFYINDIEKVKEEETNNSSYYKQDKQYDAGNGQKLKIKIDNCSPADGPSDSATFTYFNKKPYWA